ncbi:MAG: hypothetical protein K0Q55_2125 [Verrucomicrobia bacterium]|jgi:hypothetical protein|nr:hypothetical protein [Verrucomicrobiota bacterium]
MIAVVGQDIKFSDLARKDVRLERRRESQVRFRLRRAFTFAWASADETSAHGQVVFSVGNPSLMLNDLVVRANPDRNRVAISAVLSERKG